MFPAGLEHCEPGEADADNTHVDTRRQTPSTFGARLFHGEDRCLRRRPAGRAMVGNSPDRTQSELVTATETFCSTGLA